MAEITLSVSLTSINPIFHFLLPKIISASKNSETLFINPLVHKHINQETTKTPLYIPTSSISAAKLGKTSGRIS